MKLFDPHIHMTSRTTLDYEAMAGAGIAAVVEPSFWMGQPRTHVGSFEDQHRVANEMIRVGKRLFVQTPNRHFAIEPHFLFPCFQFLPVAVRVWLASRFDLGRWSTSERSDPAFRVDSVRLLSKRELRELFPRAEIVCERLAGLPKSFLVLENWQAPGIKPNEIAF